jgi:hypothetical protein
MALCFDYLNYNTFGVLIMATLTIDRMNQIATHSDLDSYIETALWSSTDTVNGQDICLDCGDYQLSEVAREEMNLDITGFWQLVIIDSFLCDHTEVVNGNIAHDFWLTRNGHGAGFWDGDYPECGDRLTELSKKFGECNLYISDAGEIEIY